MKYVVIVLFLAGFAGSALGQNIGDGADKIWLPSCPIGTGTECDRSSLFSNPISGPFSQSDSVAVGTIIEKESLDQNSIRFSLSVDFYLKNYQPFDLIVATLNDAPEPQTLPEVFWYNSPVFDEGDLVFVYLKKIEGGYRLLPESFALDKHEVRGPPPTIQMTKSPSEELFDQGEKILVSGEVRKMDLVKAAKDGKQLDAKLTFVESHDRDSVVFSDVMEIGYDGNYNYNLDTSKIPPGEYELEVNYGPSTYYNDITIKPNFKIWTPLKQFSLGVLIDEIQCRESLVLIQKYDGSPACVKPETKQCLIERGWTGINLTTKPLLERYGDLPEVKAFYETYEDAQVSIIEDHVSYFSGSDDGYFARMNLFFDEEYSLQNIDFHCYFQRTHQYELPQEDIASKITRFDCKEHGKTVDAEPNRNPIPKWKVSEELSKIGCSEAMVDHLKRYSNAFDENWHGEGVAIEDIGLPWGVHQYALDQCMQNISELRDSELYGCEENEVYFRGICMTPEAKEKAQSIGEKENEN